MRAGARGTSMERMWALVGASQCATWLSVSALHGGRGLRIDFLDVAER